MVQQLLRLGRGVPLHLLLTARPVKTTRQHTFFVLLLYSSPTKACSYCIPYCPKWFGLCSVLSSVSVRVIFRRNIFCATGLLFQGFLRVQSFVLFSVFDNSEREGGECFRALDVSLIILRYHLGHQLFYLCLYWFLLLQCLLMVLTVVYWSSFEVRACDTVQD